MSQSEYDDLDLAAAEYALGTLECEYVIDFQQGWREDAEVRARLAEWEHRLAQLGLDLDPVEPPDHVWEAIMREAGLAEQHETPASESGVTTPHESAASESGVTTPHESAASEAGVTTPRETADSESDGSESAPAANDAAGASRWRRLAIAASVAAVVLAGLSIAELPVWHNGGGADNGPAYASLIHDQPTGMSWLVTSADDGKQLSVDAMGDFNVPANKMLRMWLKPPNGKPRLVGLLPHKRGHYTMALSDAQRAALGDHSKIVVSMEDRSRAGTTTPSGKIMWAAPVAHRAG